MDKMVEKKLKSIYSPDHSLYLEFPLAPKLDWNDPYNIVNFIT